MRLTQLVERLEDGRYRCGVCQWRCALGPGEVGRCLVRVGTDAGIAVENDGLISAAGVGAVEDHRLWHCLPGTKVLAIGSWGYAFPADQQRGQYARIPQEEAKRRQLAPERAAQVALDQLCRGVVVTFSDPAVSIEYVNELLQFCRANSRYTAIVTSGYLAPAALDLIGHYLDVLALDLRGFDDASYARLGGVEQWRGVLDLAVRARERWHCHIEVTTRLHPGVNDSVEQVQAMAGWVRDALGAWTPWHILPGDAGAAAAATVARARRLAHEAGLQFVYGSDPNQSTVCPRCGQVAIERGADGARMVNLNGSHCKACDTDLHIRTSIFKK